MKLSLPLLRFSAFIREGGAAAAAAATTSLYFLERERERMASASPKSISSSAVLFPKPLNTRRRRNKAFNLYTVAKTTTPRIRASFSFSDAPVPDFLSSDWLETRRKKPFGPRLEFNAEEAVQWQLDALKYNDQPRPDYGVEVMYRFAGFDPFERSTYFGPFFDLGQLSGGRYQTFEMFLPNSLRGLDEYSTTQLTEFFLVTRKGRY